MIIAMIVLLFASIAFYVKTVKNEKRENRWKLEKEFKSIVTIDKLTMIPFLDSEFVGEDD